MVCSTTSGSVNGVSFANEVILFSKASAFSADPNIVSKAIFHCSKLPDVFKNTPIPADIAAKAIVNLLPIRLALAPTLDNCFEIEDKDFSACLASPSIVIFNPRSLAIF